MTDTLAATNSRHGIALCVAALVVSAFLHTCTLCFMQLGGRSWELGEGPCSAVCHKQDNQPGSSKPNTRKTVRPVRPGPLRHLAASMSVVRGLSRAMDTGQKQSNSAATALITLGMMDDGWMIDVLRCRLQRCSCRCLFWPSFWMARHRLIEASRMSMSEKAYCHRHLHASLFEWLVRGWEGGFQETIGGN